MLILTNNYEMINRVRGQVICAVCVFATPRRTAPFGQVESDGLRGWADWLKIQADWWKILFLSRITYFISAEAIILLKIYFSFWFGSVIFQLEPTKNIRKKALKILDFFTYVNNNDFVMEKIE